MAALNTAVVFFTALRISAELTPKRGQEFGRKLGNLLRVVSAKLLAPVGLKGDGARRWSRISARNASPFDRLIRWLKAVSPSMAVHW
jgi:hypothetical protein